MEPDKALSISQSLLGVQSGKDTYPMLRYLPAGPELGLKNVVVIQVEGLSQSLLHREEEGKAITPFLNDLSRRGFYFSNIVQNFNATDGSVFSTVTSIHKTFFNENWQYFLPVEVNGYFGSLPYLLGQEGYRHFAMHGFHNRREDFTSFMRNQGYQTVDILDFEKRLSTKWREEEHSNALGLFDGVFLNEAAEILSEVDSRFTAHLITATTHSPWMIPQVSPRPFTSDRSNTFHYLDSSIEAFFSNLKQNLSSFDETLFVIAADHTSVTYGGGAMERLRVPLIFYSPRLEKAMSRSYPETGKYGSHVDVLPTILQLLDGIQPYSGMGASLIARHRPKAGVISSNRYYSQYIKDGFVLRFSPFAPSTEEMQLFAIDNDEIIETDVSAAHPEIMKRLQAEFFSLYETSARLSKEKRLIPMVTVGAGMTIPGFDALASN
jgi:phosphoglycerol transferase MdoB-like AlkP superfamily enzyme